MKKIIIFLTVVIALSVIRLNGPANSVSRASISEVSTDKVLTKSGVSSLENVRRQPALDSLPEDKSTPMSSVELESLKNMSSILSQAAEQKFTLTNLVESLNESGQRPLVARDENPDTGEMIIVRTKNPLAGTRYFHAQYFKDEAGARFVQHMSFEFKPSSNAMREAIATVEKTFSNLSRPRVQREDYVQWGLNDKYIVWVKKMGASDLMDDPFNSYSSSDDGTIRVALELEIHGD